MLANPETRQYGLNGRLRIPVTGGIRGLDTPPLTRDQSYRETLAAIVPPQIFRIDDPNGTILTASFAHNPTSNHYDYVYVPLIHHLEEAGIVRSGDELMEITSGNSGLAATGAAKRLGDYLVTIYAPASLPAERLQPMRDLGAKLIPVPGYMIETAAKLRADLEDLKADPVWESKYYRVKVDGKPEYSVPYFENKETGQRKIFLNHSEQMSTVRSFGLAFSHIPDILPVDANVDAVFSVVGNGTTTHAMRRFLVGRGQFSNARLIGIENAANPVMYNRKHGLAKAEANTERVLFGGILPGMDWLKFQSEADLDEVVLITLEEAAVEQAEWNSQVKYSEETIGISSAMGIIAARRYLAAHPGSRVLIWFYDTGEKYAGFNAPERKRLAHLSEMAASVYDPVNRLRYPGGRQPQYPSLDAIPSSLSQAISLN